jgi:RND family efflux transporter MFP subunit
MTSKIRNRNRLKLTSALVLPLLVTATLLLPGCSRGEREQLPPDTSTARDTTTIQVTVAPVSFRPVQRFVGLVGTLYGYEETAIGSKVGGRVKRISHDVSDRIKPGDVLLEIDPTDYQLAVRQASKELQVELAKLGLTQFPGPKTDVTKIPTVVQAQLRRDNAATRLERTKTLVSKKAAPEEELTEKMSDFRVTNAEYDNQILLARAGIAAILAKHEAVAIAEQKLKDTVVTAPAPSQAIPGGAANVEYAITGRTAAEGEYVMEGAELFQLVIEHPLKFRGRVPERRIGEVRLGQKAKVIAAAYTEMFDGEVSRINPSIDPKTRAFEVEILVPNADGRLKPGGFAKTGILTTLDQQAPTVPLEALVHFAGVSKIFLVEDGKAREVQVTIGMQEDKWVEIATPKLPVGAQVVTSGQTAIADGTAVAIREGAGETAAANLAGGSAPPAESAPSVPPVARKEATP